MFENTIDRTGSMYVGGPFNCCLQLSKYRVHVGSGRLVGMDEVAVSGCVCRWNSHLAVPFCRFATPMSISS